MTVWKACRTFPAPPGRLTIVFDKGMNSDDNIAAIDTRERISFITCYSPHYAPELIHVKLSGFSEADTTKNREIQEDGPNEDLLLAFRNTGEYWGKERTVVVTYNPRTARKQRYDFEKKLMKLEEALFAMRDKVRKELYQWKDPKKVKARYLERCEELHLPKDLYDLDLEKEADKLTMRFRKSYYRINRYRDKFGKNIIITDNMDWETGQTIQASLDRYVVEKSFRNSKDDDLVRMMSLRHWTDSKIRCHILTCVITLCYLRLVEIRLKRAECAMSAATAMENMHHLHSCLMWSAGKAKPRRMIKEPTEIQARILKAFGHVVAAGGVLQKTKC
jgi:transposase